MRRRLAISLAGAALAAAATFAVTACDKGPCVVEGQLTHGGGPRADSQACRDMQERARQAKATLTPSITRTTGTTNSATSPAASLSKKPPMAGVVYTTIYAPPLPTNTPLPRPPNHPQPRPTWAPWTYPSVNVEWSSGMPWPTAWGTPPY